MRERACPPNKRYRTKIRRARRRFWVFFEECLVDAAIWCSNPCPANGNGGVTRIEARHDAGRLFCPEWRLRLVGMFALPGDLLFTEFYCLGIGRAQDVQPIPHHLDHCMPVLVNEA